MEERRPLAAMNQPSVSSFIDGSFTENLETYVVDHFPFRQIFRKIKTFWSFYLLGEKEVNGLYEKDGYLAKRENGLDEEIIAYGMDKFNYLYEEYLKEKESRCFFSVIPDKSYYLNREEDVPGMDYDRLNEIIEEKLPFAKQIDLRSFLQIEDYYKTDTHWRQERLIPIAQYLGKEMGTSLSSSFQENKIPTPFYGVYSGQWSLSTEPDDLIYLTSSGIHQAKVYNIGSKGKEEIPIYDKEKAEGKDPYDLFLSGAAAIQVLENKETAEEKELIIFRDSFAASIAPLLLSGYKTITLIDLRYIQSSVLDQYIDFNGQDILFLYSSLILNQSKSLR